MSFRKSATLPLVVCAIAGIARAEERGETVLFEEKFAGKLAKGWSWVREDRKAWRVAEKGLQIRVQPGSVWGGGTSAKNLLVRAALAEPAGILAAEVAVSHAAKRQYEQAGIVWYYDDRNMVKLVKEQIEGKSWIVMGREEADRAGLVAKLPFKGDNVELRFRVDGRKITGQFRPTAKDAWKDAGTCELPGKGPGKVSLQAYNGPKDEVRWARFSRFRILRLEK